MGISSVERVTDTRFGCISDCELNSVKGRRTMRWSFERVAGPFQFAEGPVWTGDGLLFTDIPASRILRYDPARATCAVYATDTNEANGLTLDRQGQLVVCEGGHFTGVGRRVVRYEPDGARTALAERFEGLRLNEPNDVIVDSRGRIWFTDPCYGDRNKMELTHDSVYRLDPQPDGTYAITRVTFDTTRPNGLALSRDERTLYVAESPPASEGRNELRAYPVLADGSLGPHQILHDFGYHRGGDGLRVDADGVLVVTAGWRRSGPGTRIVCVAPDGRLLGEHPVPAEPTNCCFGDGTTLYVTCADGSLLRARTDRRPPRSRHGIHPRELRRTAHGSARIAQRWPSVGC
jgi:gluconolactonase